MSVLTLSDLNVNISNMRQIHEYLEIDPMVSCIQIRNYVLSLSKDKVDDAIQHLQKQIRELAIFAPVGMEPVPVEQDVWLRPDWTPENFLTATPGFTDAQRQEAVLMTRDIPLISWYVNHRAGRPRGLAVPKKLLESQSKIIKNEWDELVNSIANNDGYQMRDDQADLFLVVGGLGAYYPANMNQDFVDMVRANFTRIDDNPNDAQITQAKWSGLGIPCAVTPNPVAGTYPVLVTEECVYNGDSYAVGKFLKSHRFTDATYDEHDGGTADIR